MWYQSGTSRLVVCVHSPEVVVVSDRRQVKTWVGEETVTKLDELADNADKSRAEVLREAIHEYVDRDRVARIEDQLDRIEEKLDTPTPQADTDTTHTHKAGSGMKQGSRATEKAREIIRRLQHEADNEDAVIQTDDVDRAIEDIAGADPRTLQKYKRIFRKRGLLYSHPGTAEVWTLDSQQWLGWLQSYAELNGADDAREVAENYQASVYAKPGGIDIELADGDNR